MKGFTSIGDLARFTQLRQANSALKSRLTVLSQEATTGLKSDVAAALHGNMGGLAQIESRLNMLDTYGQNVSLAQTHEDGLQAVLTGIATLTAGRAAQLMAAQMHSDAVLDLLSDQSAKDLGTVVNMMNSDIGGRFILSGTEVTTAPLSGSEQILGLARAKVAGLTDPAAIGAAIDDWFGSDGPDGFAASVFHGNTAPTSRGVSPDTNIRQDVNALDPALKTMLEGLVLGSLAADPELDLSHGSKSVLLGLAGQRLGDGGSLLVNVQAKVGMQQELISQVKARNASEQGALMVARSDLLSVDPYETASALTQAQDNLQNLYALTARLSSLSLTDYIR